MTESPDQQPTAANYFIADDGVIYANTSSATLACNESCESDTTYRRPNVITKIFEKYKPMRIEYENEDISLGFLFASKAMVQLLFNPFSGALIDRIGRATRGQAEGWEGEWSVC